MTLAIRQIRFTPLRADGVGPPSVMTGYYIIQPTAAYDDGVGRVEPLPFQVDIDGVSALVDLAVTPGDNSWAWKVSGFFPDAGDVYTTVEYVSVPAGVYATVLDFEDLTRLNPATLGPVTVPISTSIERRLAAVETAVASGTVTGGAPAGTGTAGRIRVSDLFDVSPTGIALGTAASATAGRSTLAAAAAANAVFTGTVTIPDNALAIADTSGLQTALDSKAPVASPTFTGTITVPTATASTSPVTKAQLDAVTTTAGASATAANASAVSAGQSAFSAAASAASAAATAANIFVEDTANPGLYAIPGGNTLIPDPVNTGLYLLTA